MSSWPNRCNIFNCKGNYPGEPYNETTKFPTAEKEPQEREWWILACPNEPDSLRSLKNIWACKSHFTEFTKARGGSRPSGPPTIFPGVPTSCLRQHNEERRKTSTTTAAAREKNEKQNDDKKDKIGSYDQFVKTVGKKYKKFTVICEDDDLTLSTTDKLGRNVVQFLHFKHVQSPFGFLYLERVEKEGFEVPKKSLNLQKNSLISRWSQLDFILTTLNCHEPSPEEYLAKVTKLLDNITELHDSPHFQFIQEQVQLLLQMVVDTRSTSWCFLQNCIVFPLQRTGWFAILV